MWCVKWCVRVKVMCEGGVKEMSECSVSRYCVKVV